MTPEERAALEAELVELQAKYKARVDEPGLEQNVIEIRARIAEVEAALAVAQ